MIKIFLHIITFFIFIKINIFHYTTGITFFFRRHTEKSLRLSQIKLQKLTFCKKVFHNFLYPKTFPKMFLCEIIAHKNTKPFFSIQNRKIAWAMISSILIYLIMPSSYISAEDCGSLINPTDKTLSLKGGWLFQKGDNPEWKDLVYFDSNWIKKTFPERLKDKTAKVIGYHWYRCHINLPENPEGYSSIAINLGKLRDADEVYFNGRIIGSTGKFSPLSPDTDKYRIYSIPDSYFQEGDNVIAIRLFSSTNYLGISMTPEIGPELSIMERYTKSQLYLIIPGAVFIVMGLFFIVGSFVRSNNKSNLYFSIFSILLGYYTLLRTNYRYNFFNEFTTSYQAELIVLCLMPVVFIGFFTEFMNIKKNKYNYIYDFSIFCIILYIIFMAKTPERWIFIIDINAKYLLVPFIYMLYFVKVLYKENKKRLRYILVGFVGLVPTVFIDSLRALDILNYPQTVHFGFIFLLISISIQLSEEMVENYKNYLKQESDLMKMERIKTKFLFNISSEFKTYLDDARILCRELMIEELNEKEISERLIKIESLGGLTKSVIDDAIRLRAIETGSYEIYTERFSLRELIVETLNMIEVRHNQKRENVNLQFITGDLEIQHNRELIFLIIYHNLENIYLYTPCDKEIFILIDVLGKNFQITFKDSGDGIPQEEQTDILKKFVRGLKVINKDVHGTGIGLTLVKAITESIGGTFKMFSIPGSGTTIEIVLPIFY
jgi:signal transduction histidine kinase